MLLVHLTLFNGDLQHHSPFPMHGHLSLHSLTYLPLVAQFLTPKFVLGMHSLNAKKVSLKTMPLNNIEKNTT